MDFTSIIALIGGIAILLVLILRFKLPAFIALLISTLSIGLFLGMDATQIFKTVEKGMGGTLGYVATVVGLGAMFGALLEVTGSAQSIAQYLLGRFGLERASWTMLLSGFSIEYSRDNSRGDTYYNTHNNYTPQICSQNFGHRNWTRCGGDKCMSYRQPRQ